MKKIILIISSIVILTSIAITTTLITKKDQYDLSNIKFENQVIEYDGESHSLVIDGKLPEGLNVVYSTNTLIDVGTIEVTASFIEEKGYEEVPDLKATLTIVPRSVTIRPNDIEVVYGDIPTSNGYQITSGEILSNDLESLNIQVVIDSTITNETSVGTYDNTISIEYTKNDNYEVTLEKGTCSIVNPTIDMSQVTFNDKTFTYDGLLHTLSVEKLPANVKVEYLVDGIEFIGTKNSGTYIVTAKFTVTNDNYVLSIDSLNATLQINKRSITLKPNDIEVVYGYTPKTNGYQITSGEILSNDLESLNIKVVIDSTITNETSVGTYDNTISIEYTKNDNYDVTLEKASYKVGYQTIDMSQVTFNDQTFTYDGLLHTLSVENLPANVKVEYLVEGIEFIGTKNSGTYIVTAKFTVTNDNYVLSIDSLNATLLINKRSITLKPNDIEVVYGYTPKTNGYQITSGEILSNDLESLNIKVVIDSTITNETSVGTYDNTISIEYTKNDNYDVTLEKASYKVGYQTIDMSQVTFNDQTLTYDGLLHTLSVENLPANVKVEYLVDGIEFTGTKNSGIYNIIAKFYAIEDEYILSNNSLTATLTIEKLSVFIQINDSTAEYSKVSLFNNFAYTTNILGDEIESFELSFGILDSINDLTNVGTYENVIICNYKENSNYQVEVINGDLTIIPTKFDENMISFVSKNFSYDGLEHTITMDTELSDDFIVEYSNNVQVEPGEYECSLTITNPNYYDIPVYLAYLVILKDGKYHDVIFNGNNNEKTKVVVENNGFVEDILPFDDKIGYTGKWDYDFSKPITSDLTISLIYTPITYTISYIIGDGINNKQNVYEYNIESPTITLYPLNTEIGEMFISWHTDPSLSSESTIYNILSGSYGDITLYPKFISYKIESAPGFDFNYDDYELPAITMTVGYNKTLITLSSVISVSRGCTWTLSKDIEGMEIIKTKNMSLKVGHNIAYVTVWYEDLYNLVYILDIYRLDMKTYTFNVGGQPYIETSLIEEDSYLNKPSDPFVIGYTFQYWINASTNEQIEFPLKVTDDIILEAMFIPNTYILSFELNGADNNVLENYNVYFGYEYDIIQPTKHGYTFKYWELRNEYGELLTIVEDKFTYLYPENSKAYAIWEINTYNITYELDSSINDTNNPSTYTVVDEIILKHPSKVGYTFNGWYLDSNFINKIETIEKGTIEDITLFAKFTPNNYTITYITNGGTIESTTQVVTYDSQYELYEITKIGYTFTGYTLNEESFVNGVYQIPNDITIEANFTPNNYTITYITNGGTIESTTQVVTYDSQYELYEIIKIGYTFTGYTLNEESFVNGVYQIPNDITIEANFTINVYNITYELDGSINDTNNPSTYTVEDEIILKDPSKVGYTFNGWYLDSNFINKIETIEKGTIEDITLFAKFTPNNYTITYITNGGTIESTTQVVTYDSQYELYEITKIGYTFTGYTLNEESFVNGVYQIPNDITIEANFTINVYNITYELDSSINDTNNPSTYTVEDEIILKDPSKVGYTFNGWYLDSNFINKIKTIEKGTIEDITLFAKFTPNNYKITYITNGGTIESTTQVVTYDSQYELYEITKIGYTFTGYTLNEESFVNGVYQIPNDITIEANFTINVYNITYELDSSNNDINNPHTYTVEDKIILKNPSKVGYTFNGWYLDSNFINKIETIEKGTIEDITLFAKFTPNNYTITYITNGGTIESTTQVVTYDAQYELYEITKIGYTFTGYTLNEESFVNGVYQIPNDITIEANFTINVYNITYELDSSNNDINNPHTYTVEDKIILKNPSKVGYTFNGWYLDSNFINKIETIEKGTIEDITLFAKFTPNNYKITYITNGGTIESTTQVVTYDAQYELYEINKKGYTFTGYTLNEESFVNGVYQIPNDITIEANFTINVYNITYELDSSINDINNPSTYTVEDEIILKDPSKVGYTFNGWYLDSNFINKIETIEKGTIEDITLFAKFTPNNYKITYITNGGTIESTTQVVTYDSQYELYEITKIGYTFTGYTLNEESFVNGVYQIPNDITIEANFTINVYNITYELDSSINDTNNPSTYTVEDEIILKDPSKVGYTFNGWYLDSNFINKIETIEKGTIEDITLFAKFTPNNYTITYITNGGTIESTTQVVTYDAQYELYEITKIGYTFTGYTLNEESFVNGVYQIPNDITIEANFVVNEYKITYVVNNEIIEETQIKYDDTLTLKSTITFGDNEIVKWIIKDIEYNPGSELLYNFDENIIINSIIAYVGTDFNFRVSNNNASITGYNGDNHDIVIPEYVKQNEQYYLVTSIGSTAFENCSSITSVIIPDSVTSIGSYSFRNCSSLISIVIPDSVTSIGKSAFSRCSNLKSIVIPDSVTSIGLSAFENCSSLTSVTIGDSVTSIDSYAFRYCSNLKSIVIPDSVTIIGSYAFENCSSLTSIIIPDSVATIEVYAFWDCSSLTSVTIGDSVTIIGKDAFEDCSSLENVYYNGTIEDWCNISFSYSSSNPMSYAEHFYMLDSNNEYYEVTQIEIPNTISSINHYQFYSFDNITSIVIPDSVTSISSSAFYNCSSLENVYYNGTIEDWCNISFSYSSCNPMSYAEHFYMLDSNNEYYEVTQIEIPNTITSIRYQFYSFDNITSIVIPDSVTSIGLYAFANCSSLTSVTIGESVTSIDSYAFYNCSSLTSIVIPDSVTGIGSSAFNNCSSITSVTIGDSVTRIDSGAFYECSSLENVYYNGTIEDWCNISFSDSSSNPMSYAEHFYMLDGNHEYYEVTQIAIPNTITSINRYQFYSFDNITSIVTPDSVTSIGYCAFENCSSLTSVTIGESVTSIGSYSFRYCSSLISIVIPDSVTSIGLYAFANCSSLTSVTIGESVTSIDSYAFANCSSLENVYYNGTIEDWCNISFSDSSSNPMSYAEHFYMLDSNNEYYEVTQIEIPNTITTINNYQFYSFDNITSIVIPDSVTSIGKSAFYNCSSLASVTIGDSVTSIGSYSFRYCSSLISIVIPDSVTSIGYGAFENCSSITSVTIGDSVTSIGTSAFENCSSLTSVTIGESVTSIGSYSFRYCSSLISIVIPDSVTSIGSYSFRYCSSLTSVIIGDSVTSIDEDAFEDCSSLTSVTIGDSVTSIGEDAFEYSSSLENVYYNGTIEDWCNIFFYDSSSNPMSYAEHFYMLDSNHEYYEVTQIEIPNTISSINNYQFYSFDNITSIVIPDSVTSIGEDAFNNCSRLENVYYNGTIEDWCNISFSDSSSNPMSYAEHFYMLDANNEYYEVTQIAIPNTITSINRYQFYSFDNITSIVIPDSVTSIGLSAFENCSSLTSVTIGDNVTSIGTSAFENCSSLTSVTIGDNVTSIGTSAFNNCSSITSVTIGDSITSIGSYSFRYCSSLENVYYNGTIEDWCNISFSYFYSNPMSYAEHFYMLDSNNEYYEVTQIEIPNTISSINNYQFYNFNNITSIAIPDSVTSIGEDAFNNCSSITSVTIGDSVTSIGSYSFRYCSSLTSIVIPDSVTSIGLYAFANCSSLTSVTIGESVTSIDSYAFYNCSSLTSIVIPDSVTGIGSSAFYNCSSLTSVTIGDSVTSIGSYSFRYCSSITNIVIPDSVTIIGSYAFENCSSLTSIVIPDSVTSIGTSAFEDCSSLTIYCKKPSKPDSWNDNWNPSNRPVVWNYNE